MQIERLNEVRKERGLQIAKTFRIMRREKGGYVVPSQSGSGAYIVRYGNDFKPICECEDFEKRNVLGIKCKHIWAVELTINKQVNSDGSTTVTKTMKVTYPQNWSAYNKSQTIETELFMKLLHDLTKEISRPYIFGRKPLDLGELIFCSGLKVYSTLSSRRTVTNYQNALEKRYINHKPHFNAVSKILNKAEITQILIDLIQTSSLPMKAIETDFAVDSTGFSTCQFDRWYNFKYGKEINSRMWLKAHVSAGVRTNIVTAVNIGDAHSNDSPYFSELVNKTADNFKINEVSADKAYSSRENIELVDKIGGTAYIPFKDSTTGKARGSMLWTKMYHYFMFKREDFLKHYHKRSNSETTFHMIKAKFGNFVRSKNHIAQVNEILLKVLCHNICVVIQETHELGINAQFPNENKELS